MQRHSILVGRLSKGFKLRTGKSIFSSPKSKRTISSRALIHSKDLNKESDRNILMSEWDIKNPIENASLTKLYMEKLIMLETCCGVLHIASLLVAFIQYEAQHAHKDQKISNWLLNLCSFITFFLGERNNRKSEIHIFLKVFFIFIRYEIKLRLDKHRLKADKKETLFNNRTRASILLTELLFVLPHPNFFLKDYKFSSFSAFIEKSSDYTINDVLSILIMGRVAFFIRLILLKTDFLSSRSYRLSNIYENEYGYTFAIKCLFKYFPNYVLLPCLLLSIFISAHCLRIAERPFDIYLKDERLHLGYYTNSMWCVTITMFTIGYGDYVPKTNLGRFIIFIVAGWGSFLTPMMVVSLSNSLDMNGSELKALNLLQRLNARRDLKKETGKLLGAVVSRKFKERVRARRRKSSSTAHYSYLKKQFERLRNLKNSIKSSFNEGNEFDLMGSYFDELREEVRVFSQNQQILLKQLKIEPATLNQVSPSKSTDSSFYSKYEKFDKFENVSNQGESRMDIFSGSDAQESLEDDK